MDLKERLPSILWTVGSLLVGVMLAFFAVFVILFSDGPQNVFDGECLAAYGIAFTTFFVAGAILLRFAGPDGKVFIATLLAPATILVAVYAEPPVGLRTLALTSAFIGAGLGAWFGSWWSSRSKQEPQSSD